MLDRNLGKRVLANFNKFLSLYPEQRFDNKRAAFKLGRPQSANYAKEGLKILNRTDVRS